MSPRKNNSRLFFLLFLFLIPSFVCANQILFYYNSSDGTQGALLHCVTILRAAGHEVKVIDVAGRNYDPTNDNWGPPYDQVWDMRFVDRDKEMCGSGIPSAADYFGEHWRFKAVSYLNHCGKLFIAGEHYQLTDRMEGIYQFLTDIEAVKEGYDSCPPSSQGNSTTNSEAFYPVRQGLGPTLFFGAYVGGIPKVFLNGTSFVETREDWLGNDRVNRSIVSGWTGDQLGGLINTPLSCRGKLFLVWDATMWTLWQVTERVQPERAVPWDEKSWFSWNSNAGPERQKGIDISKAKAVTKNFFSSVANWLDNSPCPCEPSFSAVSIIPTAIPISTFWKARSQLSAIKASNPLNPPPFPTTESTALTPISPPNGPETIYFSVPPVNLYMRFLDGAGGYQLEVLDFTEKHLRTIYHQQVGAQKEAWASWDGTNELGQVMGVGNYYAVLSKNGFLLKKIDLIWIAR